MTPDDPDRMRQVRSRQRGRAVIMAIALAAFVVLMYFITIARIGSL